MMVIVILDADFLSAMLKIGRLGLVRDFYQVEDLYIAPAVHREIAQTNLPAQLVALPWVVLTAPDPEDLENLREDEDFCRLGAGDQASIALALATEQATLLTNDNRCRGLAADLGVTVVNIPAFLLVCKMAGQLTTDELRAIIEDLWQQDHYKFRRDIEEYLLA